MQDAAAALAIPKPGRRAPNIPPLPRARTVALTKGVRPQNRFFRYSKVQVLHFTQSSYLFSIESSYRFVKYYHVLQTGEEWKTGRAEKPGKVGVGSGLPVLPPTDILPFL